MHVFFRVIFQVNQQVFISQYVMREGAKEMCDPGILLSCYNYMEKAKCTYMKQYRNMEGAITSKYEL